MTSTTVSKSKYDKQREVIAKQITDDATLRDDDAVDSLLLLQQACKDGDVSKGDIRRINNFLVTLGEAVKSGEEPDMDNLPQLGSSTTEVVPEHLRPIDKAIKDKTLEIDDATHLPKPILDNRGLTDALSRIERAMGLGVVVGSSPEDRVEAIETEAKELKSKATDDTSKLLDHVGGKLGIDRNSGESDKDYRKRIDPALDKLPGWAADDKEIEKLAKNQLGRDRNKDEKLSDFVKEALEKPQPSRRSRFGRRGGES